LTFDSTTKVFGVDDTIDHVRAASVGVTFDAADRLGGVNVVDVAFAQGLHALGASRNGDQYLSRATGRVDFRKAVLYAQRMQSLAFHWSILAAANAQYAFTDLLASEMFSVGGELFGRGYDPSALLNDHGAAAKLELQYSRLVGRRRLVALNPYVFGDTGTVWQRTRLPGVDPSATALSAGGGLRLNVGYRLAGFVEAAKPFNPIPGQDSSRDIRIFVGASVR
jgi:hemolysin activation/secretion protein